jgi:uncharacterized membrane-anchored protein
MASLIGFKQFTIRTGDHILLKAAPVDPRDLFRGDYVALGYEISRPPQWTWEGDGFQEGDIVYVTLQREGRFWITESVRKSPPKDAALFVQGRIAQVVLERSAAASSKSEKPAAKTTEKRIKEIAVDYGIESYFLPTKRAKEMDEVQRRADMILVAEVVVDHSGRAVLRNVFAEKGKPIQRLEP